MVAIMDLGTPHVPAWRLSNTKDTPFCVEALEEALTRYCKLQIFNTDQAASSPASLSAVFSGMLVKRPPWIGGVAAWTVS